MWVCGVEKGGRLGEGVGPVACVKQGRFSESTDGHKSQVKDFFHLHFKGFYMIKLSPCRCITIKAKPSILGI